MYFGFVVICSQFTHDHMLINYVLANFYTNAIIGAILYAYKVCTTIRILVV